MAQPTDISLGDLRQWVEWVDAVGLHDGEVVDLADIAAGRWPAGLRYWPPGVSPDCAIAGAVPSAT
jgi:hypothetical protein